MQLLRPACLRQWARVLAASAGCTAVGDVRVFVCSTFSITMRINVRVYSGLGKVLNLMIKGNTGIRMDMVCIMICVNFTFLVCLISSQVPQELSSQPLQRFFADFPGLTGFIGRIMLSYFDNTITLNQEDKPQTKKTNRYRRGIINR